MEDNVIKIYGSPASSAGRCFWCLEEVGAKYEQVSINFKEGEHKSPDYLALNPNGKVPTLVDGDLKLWESAAINFYLCDAYKKELLGATIEERALVRQWSFWALNDLQPPLVAVFIQKVFVPEERRDLSLIESSQKKIKPMLDVLDKHLSSRSYLVSEEFTLADLNVMSVVSICNTIEEDISKYENINKWKEKIEDRPSYKKYLSLMKK